MEVINVTIKIDRSIMSMAFAFAGEILDDEKWEKIFSKEYDLDDLENLTKEERNKFKIALACIVAADKIKE